MVISDYEHCLLVNFVDMWFLIMLVKCMLSTVQHAGCSDGGGRSLFSEVGGIAQSEYQITRAISSFRRTHGSVDSR